MIFPCRCLYKVALLLICCGIMPAAALPAPGDKLSADAASADWKPIPQDGVITAPGNYFLQDDMLVERNTGIEIKADDVTLDFRGHALRFTQTPRAGTFGVVANDRTGIALSNGKVGGFWFNVHCTQNVRLRITGMVFDDIPYLAVNAAQSRDVAICDNVFVNFRYDVSKDEESAYVIGVNIGAEDAVVCNNRFEAAPEAGRAKDVGVETVFVLFSAQVSQKCLAGQNEMTASELLPRSYGVWVASKAQAAIAFNRVRNLKYGVCLASDARGLVCYNEFAVDAAPGEPAAVETFGISAAGAEEIFQTGNRFEGLSRPTVLPEKQSDPE